MKKPVHGFLPWLLPSFLVIFHTACGGSGSKTAAPPAPPPSIVSVVVVEPTDVPVYGEYPAQTFARDLVEVRGRVDGYIQKRLFQVGSDVQAGKVLFELDPRTYQADVAKAKGDLDKSIADSQFAADQVAVLQAQADVVQAQANLAKAKQDVARLDPLVKQEAAAQQDLDNARSSVAATQAALDAKLATLQQTRLQVKSQIATTAAQVAGARAQLQTAQLNLEYATITAPISGRIGEPLTQVGGLVSHNSASPLTTIVPLDPIWVRYKVSEGEYLQYKEAGKTGLNKVKLTMLLADGTTYPFPGAAQNTVNSVDSKTGTLEIQATFPNPKHTLLPGQYGRVRYVTDEQKGALLVPQRAVLEMQGTQSVYIVGADNKAEVRTVVPGVRSGNNWVIAQGLNAGDKVVVEGTMKIRPGAPVNPRPYAPDKRADTPADNPAK